VEPDFLCLAKGLTGGYLPMAATLTTQTIFDAFLGEYEEFKTFFHGHSFTNDFYRLVDRNDKTSIFVNPNAK
jgi:adenosylmethionine-8-amino-7-oxononanoate aminotransferase